MGKSAREMLPAGAKAPSCSLRDSQGKDVALNEIVREGPALLVFYKTDCPVCQFTLPFLERLKDNGKVRVVGVSQDGADDTGDFQREFGVTFSMMFDEKRSGYVASNGFGISHVPTMFQVEPDGVVSHSWTGWSKQDMVQLGERVDVPVLQPDERVPAFKPG